MRRVTARLAVVGLILLFALTVVPMSTARAQVPPGLPPGAPGGPPPFIAGFFLDPLWPGPGLRFIAVECPIGVGLTIVHYCPGLPPVVDPPMPPPPVLSADVMQCDPFFQYFPVCRRPRLPE
jgi:hypothetical protein